MLTFCYWIIIVKINNNNNTQSSGNVPYVNENISNWRKLNRSHKSQTIYVQKRRRKFIYHLPLKRFPNSSISPLNLIKLHWLSVAKCVNSKICLIIRSHLTVYHLYIFLEFLRPVTDLHHRSILCSAIHDEPLVPMITSGFICWPVLLESAARPRRTVAICWNFQMAFENSFVQTRAL